MRTTIVPAQITTVEDRIVGSISPTQLMLLIAPIFIGSASFVVLPPFFNYAIYKIVVIVCIAFFSGLLAIRIKGKIVLFWLIALLQYNLRPRYYVLDKNDIYLREEYKPVETPEVEAETEPKKVAVSKLAKLSTAELVQVEELLADPTANARFEINKKGGISVHITEVAN